ncbi:chromatin regulatory protein sir2 [Nesidiocoris tenuis]|uniref:protein acetyllysine N-acetyltransferase n=1 Tax=Nesidiocoris tenuis TaxID=355587 RepID=A0ABN7AM83_9HEMI|nr:chromatin regulatory protein sir2 [Nesidiocoris tenuis]
MSCSYADGLSPYDDKGVLGIDEVFDSAEKIKEKAHKLAEWIKAAKHVVFHTGAGISTSAGIPDFRGPNGVWTLEEKGEKPTLNVSFNEAIPTPTHMGIVELVRLGFVHYVISQNIDGLHLRSGLKRTHLAELHGNMFIEQCFTCKRQFVLKNATTSVGQKFLGRTCSYVKHNTQRCRGKMKDTILDWEHDLPEKDLLMAEYHSSVADLSVTLGTTLQIVPSGNLPLLSKKHENGKLVICNLQPTKHNKKADIVIHGYVDEVIRHLLEYLEVKPTAYEPEQDPTRNSDLVDWTIPDSLVNDAKELYKAKRPIVKRKTKKERESETKIIKRE